MGFGPSQIWTGFIGQLFERYLFLSKLFNAPKPHVLLKNWCFWTVVLEKALESPSDFKEIQPVHPKGNQSWVFIGRTGAEAEAPTFWSPNENWLFGQDPNAGRDRSQEKGTTEDEMVEWHHQLNGHEFEQTPGAGDGQGGLPCCSPWGHKEMVTTQQLNWGNIL